MTDTKDLVAAEPESPCSQAGPLGPGADLRHEPHLWRRLGRQLHAISHLRIPFWVLAFYFQFQTMFLSTGQSLLDNLNGTLLMYGIAMSFEGLRDSNAISQKKRAEYLAHHKAFRWTAAVILAGGLFSIAVGCWLFFLADYRELGWAITIFGLGMLSLGRLQYDRLASVLAATHAPEKTDSHGPGPKTATGPELCLGYRSQS